MVEDLQSTRLFAETDVVWEKLSQPIRASSRLRYTAVSVSACYIALGSSTGAVYVFDKNSIRLLHHLPGDKEGPIVNLRFSPNENVIANATEEGSVVVTELNITRRAGSRQLKVITDQRGSTVTAMVWNDAGTQLYIGDDRGRVLRVNVSLSKAKDILQAPNEFILRSDGGGEIVQLCMRESILLVSTLHRTWLCDTIRREYYPIGKQERNGKFGSCFYVRNDDVRVLCARPRSRVWEATLQAQVVNTHQMKQRLATPSLPVIRMRDEPLNLIGEGCDASHAKLVNFYNFYPIGNGFIFTWSDDGIYVFDPSRPNSLIWSSVRDISNIDVYENDIFYLDSNSRVMRVTMVTPDSLVADLFSHELFSQCADLAVSYSSYVALPRCRESVSVSLMETLVTKLEDEPLILERLGEVICKLETADKSVLAKIVPVDDDIAEGPDEATKDQHLNNGEIRPTDTALEIDGNEEIIPDEVGTDETNSAQDETENSPSVDSRTVALDHDSKSVDITNEMCENSEASDHELAVDLGTTLDSEEEVIATEPDSRSESSRDLDSSTVDNYEVSAAILTDPEPDSDAVLSRNYPDDAILSIKTPDDAILSSGSPDDAILSRESPDEAILPRKDPDDAILSAKSPDNAILNKNYPDDAILSTKSPDDILSRESPDDAILSIKTPDDAILSRGSPDDAILYKNYPDDAILSRKSPDDAILSEKYPNDEPTSETEDGGTSGTPPPVELRRFKNHVDGDLSELLSAPLALVVKSRLEDGGSYSESEVTGLRIPTGVDQGLSSTDASPKTARKKNMNRRWKTAVVEFGEPVGKKNVKGNVVAYAEKQTKSKKNDDQLEVPPPSFAKSRSLSVGDNMSQLPNKLDRVAAVRNDAGRHRGSLPTAERVPVFKKAESQVAQKTDETEEYDEDAVPVPLHTSGQPVDPTLRKLKKFSEKVRSNSQVFLKHLKENFKEKALDSFRDNWTLDPMNTYFYPDGPTGAMTTPDVSEQQEKDEVTETKAEDKKEVDVSIVDVILLEEATRMASVHIAEAASAQDATETMRSILEKWVSVLHRTMAVVHERSCDRQLEPVLSSAEPNGEVGDEKVDEGLATINGECLGGPVVFAISSESSSEEAESSGEHYAVGSEKTVLDDSRIVLVNDPFGLSETICGQLGQLLNHCVRLEVFGSIDNLATRIEQNLRKLPNNSGKGRTTTIVGRDLRSESDDKSTTLDDDLLKIREDDARLVWLTSSADSTNESRCLNETVLVSTNHDDRSMPAEEENTNDIAGETDSDQESGFPAVSGPLKESTTLLVLFVRCYLYYFEPLTLRSFIHELERTERYRVWLMYVDCLKAMSASEALYDVVSGLDPLTLRADDLKSDLLKSRAGLAHLNRLFLMEATAAAESLCCSLPEQVKPLDVLFLVRSSNLDSGVFLRYMDQLWRKANDSEVIMTSLCSDAELKESWLQVLLTAADVLDSDVKCQCGMPRPFTHSHDWPSRSLIDNVLQYGAGPTSMVTELLWQRGMWSPWLRYGGRYGSHVLTVGVVVQLGDMAELDRIVDGKLSPKYSDPAILEMIIRAKSDQTDDPDHEPMCWKCIECQRQFNLDPGEHFGPFSVPPHRVMTWERLSQVLVDRFGLEACVPILRRRAPVRIVRRFVAEDMMDADEHILDEVPTITNKNGAEEIDKWISASAAEASETTLDGASSARVFTPVGKSSPAPDGWPSMESFTDFWAPKPSSMVLPAEKRMSGSAESDLGNPSTVVDDVEASSESSAAAESPARFPRKRLTHRTRRTANQHPDDSWEILPEKRTPPRRSGSSKKSMEQRLQEWEVVPEKWILGQEPETKNRTRKRSIEAVLSGKLKGLIGLELNAVNARGRSSSSPSNRMVEMTPTKSWASNSSRGSLQFNAIHNRKGKTTRKSSAEADLISSNSPCVICGNPLLDIVGGRDPNVSIFPCQHGYHRACIVSDDRCLKCFIDEQRKMMEGL